MTSVDRAGRTYRGAPARQRQQERREKLLDAAVAVFGTTGYRTATVERVCAEAGLTKRYFYESFPNSEALLMDTYRRITETMRANILRGAESAAGESGSGESGSGESAESLLRGALTGFFTTIADDPRSAKIAFVEILGVSAEVDALYRTTTASFAHTVLAIAESVGSARGLAGPDRRTLATGLVGAVLMIAQQWLLATEPEPLDTVIAGAHTILAAVVFGRVET